MRKINQSIFNGLFLFTFFISVLSLSGIKKSWGQVSITPIRTDVSGFATWTDSNIGGTTYLQLLLATSSTVSPAMDFNSCTGETLNFKARTYGGVNSVENTITVSISTDNGGSWSDLGTRVPASSTLTAMTAFDLSAYNGTQVRIRFTVAGTLSGVGAGIDDINISGVISSSPVLNVTPATLAGMTYVFGNGPSTSQSFDLSGSNLSGAPGDITISGSTSFEVSSDNSSFGSSTTIAYSSATLNATPVYVRLKAELSEATYNENISYSGGGVSSADFSCSGSVTSATPSKKILFDASSGQSLSSADWVVDADTYDAGWNSSGVCYTSGTEANAQRYPTPATPTSESDWDGGNSKWAYELFLLGYTIESLGPCQDITYGDGSNPQDLSNYDVFICNEPNVQFTTAEKTAIINFVNAGGGLYMGADHGDTSTEICGANTEADRNCDGWNSTEVWNDLMSGDPFGIQFDNNNTNSPTTSNVISDATDPLLHGSYGNVSSMSFNDGATMTINNANNASAKGVVFMTGTSLPATTNAMVTYASYGAGRVVGVGDSSPTGDATGDTNGETRYNNWIDADNGTIIMNATIWLAEGSTRFVVSPSSLTGFTYEEGAGPSSDQTFTLSGYGLVGSGNITVTGSSDYEVSTDGITYASSVTYPYASGIITGQPNTVYVRLISGLSAGDYNSELIAISGGSATTINVTCSGTVTAASAPSLTSSVAALTGFTYVEGSGPSANQTFTISGSNLTSSGDITVTGTTNYEVSTDGTTFTSSVAYPYASGVITGQPNTVYIRLKSGLSAGSYNSENITISGGSATATNVICSGDITITSSAYSGVGNFQLITNTDDLTDGYYVIVNSADAFAMNNTNAGTYFTNTAVTPSGGIIVNPATSIVWKIETNGSGKSIYNEASAKYVSYTGSSNASYAVDAVTTDAQRWSFTYASGVFSCANLATPARILQYNASSPRFACYTTAQQKLHLYKYVITCTPPSAPTTTGGTICGTGTVGLSASGAVAGEVYKWYSAVSGGSALKTSTDESDNTYTTESVSSTTTYYVARYITATSCESTPRTAVVATINQLPSITLDISPRVCSGTTSASLAYTATTDSPDQYSITWDAAAISAGFADVALTSLPATPINLTIPGSAPATLYNGTIYVKNSTTGCSGTGTGFTVLIIDPVSPAITNSITTGTNPSCAGSSVTFTASATNLGFGTPSYQWKNGTTDVGTNSSVYTTTGLSDSDDISCVLTVAGGCVTSSTATSNTVTMTINPVPATPSAGSNSAICSGSDLNLTSDATGTIAWTGPNSFSSAVQNPVISSATSAAGGTYSVTSTVGGCTSIAGTTEVTVNAPVISGTMSVSIGSTTTLSGTPAVGTWSSGTTSVATIDAGGTVSGVAEGTSVITYSVGGCDATATITSSAGPCLGNEGFDGGSTPPTGWTFSGITGTYSTSAYYGTASPSLKLDADNQVIETPSFTNASELSFYCFVQTGFTSGLLIEGWDGSSWLTVHNNTSLPQNDATAYITYNASSTPALTSGFTKFRFTFTKNSGNGAFDDVTVFCNPLFHEIGLSGNGNAIINGDNTPQAGDFTDFGDAAVAGGTVDRTFTIYNFGTEDLNLTGNPIVAVTGDFTVTSQPSSSTIAGGSSLTFTVRFDPTTTGLRTGTISIANDDPNENPYNFTIQGNGLESASPWLIDEKFDNVSSIGTITNTNTTGFTATGTGTISAATAAVCYNRSANALTFLGAAGSSVTITTPVFANADMLSFWYKQPNVASTNPFVVEQYSSAKAGWTTLATIPGGAASSKPAVYFYPLGPDITQIRFTYTRTDASYQGYLDDVRIRSAGTCTSDIKIIQTLVQSCGGGEGINESVIFKTGTNPVSINDLSVSFPNVGIGGTEYSMEADQKFVSNPAYIAQLNDLVHLSYPACSPAMEPPSGIIPANSYAVIFTGKSPTVTYDFKDACISGTNYYVVFCDNTNTAGRYGNTPDAGELDYTAIIDKATGCYDSQFYDSGIPNTLGALASYDETTRIRTYTDYGCEIIILPVELKSFEAKCQNDYVFISWATTSEINNGYFELQKSNDGVFWYNIAVIDGAGNSNNTHNYSFSDKQYDSNKAYYRLKQVDTDGKSEYSDIIYSDCSANNTASVLIYPNPCNERLNITVENWFSNSIKIEITDIPGQLVWSSALESPDGFGIKQTDTENLKPGLYFIRLSDGNQSIVKKFIKQ